MLTTVINYQQMLANVNKSKHMLINVNKQAGAELCQAQDKLSLAGLRLVPCFTLID